MGDIPGAAQKLGECGAVATDTGLLWTRAACVLTQSHHEVGFTEIVRYVTYS